MTNSNKIIAEIFEIFLTSIELYVLYRLQLIQQIKYYISSKFIIQHFLASFYVIILATLRMRKHVSEMQCKIEEYISVRVFRNDFQPKPPWKSQRHVCILISTTCNLRGKR